MPLNIPISFRSNTLYMTKKKKKRNTKLSRPHFSTICQSPSGPSLYLLPTPFSLLFYRILICIASHRLAAGFIRTRGKYGGINVGHLLWKKKGKKGMESGDDVRQWRKVDRGKARHANWTGIQTPLPWSLLSDTLGDCLEMRRDEREEEEKSRRRSLPPLICPRNYPSFLLAGKCLIILEILGEKVGRVMGRGTSSLKELRVRTFRKVERSLRLLFPWPDFSIVERAAFSNLCSRGQCLEYGIKRDTCTKIEANEFLTVNKFQLVACFVRICSNFTKFRRLIIFILGKC